MIRLQKYLASCGVDSRRHCESLITDGKVSVNGRIVTELGTKVDELNDCVSVNGVPVTPETERHYIIYNKPVGEVTTVSDPEGRETVMDHFSHFPVRLFPVGRLDYDSEGLLLLTNDGDLMNRLLHPSREIDKGYLTVVSGHVSEQEIEQLRTGVIFENRLSSPASIRLVRYEKFATVLVITIHEGRNRQVRKMIESVNHKVLHLKRIQFGPLFLNDLPVGRWRELNDSEIARLKES